jgi:alpha-glucan, water dikinase
MANENIPPAAEPAATTENIATGSGLNLVVEKRFVARRIELLLRAQTPKRCVLHWGIRAKSQAGWHSLPRPLWPEGTTAAGADAMETPFREENGESRIAIAFSPTAASDIIEFALFFPDEGRWDNNSHRNYQISVPNPSAPRISVIESLKAQLGSAEILLERAFDVENLGKLAAGLTKSGSDYRILLVSDLSGPLALHWGIARRSPHEWLEPPESVWPPGTVLWEGRTAQTAFEMSEGLNRLELVFPESEVPLGIQFVLKQGTDGSWLKHHHGNFYIPIHGASRQAPQLKSAELGELSNRIIQSESGTGSWTLMHRFNLCFDLLGQARGNTEALALLYVWLRFSAIRQLTWQRNYNTKPRELAHAQDRLTNRLAEFCLGEHNGRPLLRLMLATIGRGGDGQRIRDEILQIMHRHHVKEVGGHFLEEWHQKLHNNTTPDDVVICEAYLEFLRSNGNLERFLETLQKGGVTRERLETFERPIRSNPDFVPHLKDALIHDFENFLKVLNAVHSSTDLETAINTARDRLDADTQALLWQVWNHRNDLAEALVPLVEQISEARRRVSHLLHNGQQVRPLLYLDLALEQLVRVVIERNLHQHLRDEQLVDLIGRVLENVTLSYEEVELGACLRHWDRLSREPIEPRLSVAWSLHAKSVADRIGRALADWTDQLYQLLQPKAEFLGQSFNAETWTITLFSEEVVRGSSLGFALSMLLHQAGRVLRQGAHLGDWQIVSRGRGTGQVEVVEALRSVQGKQFKSPTVVIADKVMGDEELPKEIVAVIAPDVTDLVSHVAVRARNARVLFASCSDPGVLEYLKAQRGRFLSLEVTAAGDVVFKDAERAEPPVAVKPDSRPRLTAARPRFTRFAVTMDEFNEQIVGGKSCSQARLRGKLPTWVRQPASVALPFGSFEKVLSMQENQQTAQRYGELSEAVKKNSNPETLVTLRNSIESLTAPAELKTALREAMSKAGLALPEDWESAWHCIKQVWASKWNERAVLSRKRIGLEDEDLFMAVLIQSVVEADYAFVIHTVNPSTSNRHELYAEVVLGLGETLVGNFPGRALSFVWNKSTEQARLISFPSKSIGLYGGGLIFRSDSNGEDLAGYAGAGLYDSVLLKPPRRTELDYSDEPLIWDEGFRNGLLAAIAKMGLSIEEALSSPQDIEGAVSKGEYFVVQTRPQVGLDNQA